MGIVDDAQRAALEKDASRFMDIYIMDADGGNVRRLTDSNGYDGGPFFSADGSRIVWRRFDAAGKVAEIWTMNADGSDQRQITESRRDVVGALLPPQRRLHHLRQ